MILVDAHVHIYDCFDLESFFDSAYSNFKNEAVRSGYGKNFIGILLLSETLRYNWFHHLSRKADGGSLPGYKDTGNWTMHRTDERCSLHVQSGDNRNLFIITGRQIVTLEGLEVLSLASAKILPDGLPIRKLIANVRDNGGIPVIPWGFGKWMGRRGEILSALIRAARHDDFYLGDNGGRPFLISVAEHFRLAKKKGIRILPGSDPLPFRSEQKRVGSFGLSLEVKIDPAYPAQDIKEAIFSNKYNFYPYGSMEKNIRFVSKQLRMQFEKRTC